MTVAVLMSSTGVLAAAAPSESSSGSSSSESSSSEKTKDDKSGSDADKDTSSGVAEGASGSAAEPPKATAPVPAGVSSSVASYRPDFADSLRSRSIYMINLDSDSVVFEQNAQERVFPASLTKIMTAIVALESDVDLDKETTSLKAYIQSYLYELGGASLGGIYLGETLTIRDLLYATIVQSACEAAMMVGDYIGDGDIENFVALMNKKAKEIGAKNTNFTNTTGLYDENNYSTAYDMALIMKYAMQNPEFVDMVGANVFTSKPTDRHANGITWTSYNSMQIQGRQDYYEGVKGGKTGTLPEQNIRNLATTATRDGYTYLLIVMGAPFYDEAGAEYANNIAMGESRLLYDWAFGTFKVKTLMEVGQEVAEVNVRLSLDKDHIKLLARDKFASLVPADMTTDDIIPKEVIEKGVMRPVKDGKKGEKAVFIDAPIRKGDPVGYVSLTFLGEEIGRVQLVAAENVEQSKSLYYLEKVKSLFDNFLVKFILVLALVILVLYIALMVVRNRNRRRYAQRRRPPQGGRGGRT